jgi:hypothetical protein
MPRGKVTEESLVARIAKLDEQRKVLKKKLQVMRIRAAAHRRKALFTSIRRNEKEVIEVIKSKAPDFFKKLVEEKKPRAGRKAAAKKRGPGRRKRAA